MRPHRLAAFRTDELDQDIDRLGDLLLLCSVWVGEIVAIVLEVFGDAGVDRLCREFSMRPERGLF
jgi:hypothetical protein